jgi:hypothetical protein
LRDSLIDAVRAPWSVQLAGRMRPDIIRGAVGRDAMVIGAALLPLHANFLPRHESFLKPGLG